MGLFLLCRLLQATVEEPDRTVALSSDVPVVGRKIKPPSCLPIVGLLHFDALNWRLSTKGLSAKHRLMPNVSEQNKFPQGEAATAP